MGEALVVIGASNGWGPYPLTAEQADLVLKELTSDMERVQADVTVLRRRSEAGAEKGMFRHSEILFLFCQNSAELYKHAMRTCVAQSFWHVGPLRIRHIFKYLSKAFGVSSSSSIASSLSITKQHK